MVGVGSLCPTGTGRESLRTLTRSSSAPPCSRLSRRATPAGRRPLHCARWSPTSPRVLRGAGTYAGGEGLGGREPNRVACCAPGGRSGAAGRLHGGAGGERRARLRGSGRLSGGQLAAGALRHARHHPDRHRGPALQPGRITLQTGHLAVLRLQKVPILRRSAGRRRHRPAAQPSGTATTSGVFGPPTPSDNGKQTGLPGPSTRPSSTDVSSPHQEGGSQSGGTGGRRTAQRWLRVGHQPRWSGSPTVPACAVAPENPIAAPNMTSACW